MSTIKKYSKSISSNTKMYILLSVLLVVFSQLFNAEDTNYVLPSIAALLTLFAIENYMIFAKKYPYIWNIIKWSALAAIILITLISFRI